MKQEDYIILDLVHECRVVAHSPKMLHDRLGHPHLSKLKKMCPELSGLQILECESCQLGKHFRCAFPKRSQSQCKSSFSIIHSNIWGPSRVSSFDFRYFVTLLINFQDVLGFIL